MTEHPIIFTAPMIRAILDGRKTQTRRLLKGRPPKFAVGDRLWVREALVIVEGPLPESIAYRADYRADEWAAIVADQSRHTGFYQVKSPIHMPRDFSRITLEVTETRIQRVQDISEADAVAEGVDAPPSALMPDRPYAARFRALWNSIHGGGAWDRNDEVAAYTFTVRAKGEG
jgi:hypothetical protein